MPGTFPFGAPLLDRSLDAPVKSFKAVIVGAYPSALHVRWTPPPGTDARAIAALAVDNEPSPFWTGSDATDYVNAWAARWFKPEWGTVSAPAGLNGPSGGWLLERVIGPLLNGEEPFITDCLTTYRTSEGQLRRITDTYEFLAPSLGLPSTSLPPHPSETEIVNEAKLNHMERLARQIVAAEADQVITLGNAAARVIAALTGEPSGGQLVRETYGSERRALIEGRDVTWLPLAHPGAPQVWQDLHTAWLSSRG